MASLIELDLPPEMQRAADTLKTAADFSIGNAAGDAAMQAIQDTSEKTKAVVDAIIASVEADVQDVALNGVQQLYDALGLNGETIQFARNIVQMAMHAANLAEAGVLKGMEIVNSADIVGLPMSAVAAGLQVAQTFADRFVGELIDKYGVWAALAIEFVVDPDAAIEAIMNELDILANQVYNLIDSQVQKYLGLSISQLMKMANEGIRLYKELQEMKKRKHREKEEKQQQNESEQAQEQMPISSGSKSKTKVKAKVSINEAELRANLMLWLKDQNDAIYNGFIVVEVLDAIKSIQEVTKMIQDVNVKKMAESINSLEDLIDLLEELGLADDSRAIDLSLIPSLNINAIYASMNSIKDNFSTEKMMRLGAAVAGSVDADIDVSKQKLYDVTTDADASTIDVVFYNNAQNGAKDFYKSLKKAKDINDKRVFSEAELKIVNEHIAKLEKDGDTETFKVGKYTFTLKLTVTDSSTDDKSVKKATPVTKPAALEEIKEWQSEKADKDSKRSTIAVLHTIFSVLKNLLGVLKPLIILINNYQINKEYAMRKHSENLVECFMDALKHLGLGESQRCDGNSPTSAKMYPVRTVDLYDYVTYKLRVKMESDSRSELLTESEKTKINVWLKLNDEEAPLVEMKCYTKLFIDHGSIEEERKCRERLLEELTREIGPGAENLIKGADACKKVNGIFGQMDNLEQIGDYVIYSDSKLPRQTSQILEARQKEYNP